LLNMCLSIASWDFNKLRCGGPPTSLLVHPAVAWYPSNEVIIRAQYLEASTCNEQGPPSLTEEGCTPARYTLAAGKLTGRSSRENLGEAPEVGESELTQFLLQYEPSLPMLNLRASPIRARDEYWSRHSRPSEPTARCQPSSVSTLSKTFPNRSTTPRNFSPALTFGSCARARAVSSALTGAGPRRRGRPSSRPCLSSRRRLRPGSSRLSR
jgi:hypothetical protein